MRVVTTIAPRADTGEMQLAKLHTIFVSRQRSWHGLSPSISVHPTVQTGRSSAPVSLSFPSRLAGREPAQGVALYARDGSARPIDTDPSGTTGIPHPIAVMWSMLRCSCRINKSDTHPRRPRVFCHQSSRTGIRSDVAPQRLDV